MSDGSKAHVLGLLTDALEGSYQSEVLRGVADAAREHGAALRCLAAGVLGSRRPDSARRNALLDLVGAHNVDGLVVMAGALANEVGLEQLSAHLERYGSLPVCSVGVELPGAFDVLVDNAGGVRNAMRHLVLDCRRRRVAFVRGPAANREAESRYRAYLDALARLRLPIVPSLVVEGDFTRASGATAAQTLLAAEERPDAILVADDTMALGVLDGLLAHDVAVPEEISVVGFNDVEEAAFAPVPLTTVRQPLYQQGRRAALALLSILDGSPAVGRVVLSTELVRRRSSGLRHEVSPSAASTERPDAHRESRWLDMRREAVDELHHVLTTPTHTLSRTWAPRLLDAFARDLAGGDGHSAFSQAVREMVSHALRSSTHGASIQDAISIVQREALALLGPLDPQRLRVEDLCEEARVIVAEQVEHAGASRPTRTWARSLGRALLPLIGSFDVDELVVAMAEHLPRLGIESCYLSLLTDEPGRAELRLAFDVNRPSWRPQERVRFDARDLVPPGVLDDVPRAFVVQSLFFGERPHGFVLLELGPREGVIYEALRDQISAALEGARLVELVRDRDRECERLRQALASERGADTR